MDIYFELDASLVLCINVLGVRKWTRLNFVTYKLWTLALLIFSGIVVLTPVSIIN